MVPATLKSLPIPAVAPWLIYCFLPPLATLALHAPVYNHFAASSCHRIKSKIYWDHELPTLEPLAFVWASASIILQFPTPYAPPPLKTGTETREVSDSLASSFSWTPAGYWRSVPSTALSALGPGLGQGTVPGLEKEHGKGLVFWMSEWMNDKGSIRVVNLSADIIFHLDWSETTWKKVPVKMSKHSPAFFNREV